MGVLSAVLGRCGGDLVIKHGDGINGDATETIDSRTAADRQQDRSQKSYTGERWHHTTDCLFQDQLSCKNTGPAHYGGLLSLEKHFSSCAFFLTAWVTISPSMVEHG